MRAEESQCDSAAASGCQFGTTHWSVVLAAGQSTDARSAALEQLCLTYWYPIYAYVRRNGHDPATAEDLTQAFFARLLANNYLAAVEPSKGRFRWFLLSAVKRFLINERDRNHAEKRGGNRTHVSFDGERAEERYRLETADHLSPDRLFDRAWAADLIEGARQKLAEECALEGKRELFAQLEVLLAGDEGHATHAEIAARLGTTEGAVKVAVHRLRRRYRELLRDEVAQTVGAGEALEDELRELLAVFAD